MDSEKLSLLKQLAQLGDVYLVKTIKQDKITKKQFIVNAISEMNISILKILLDDSKTYGDVPKEKFIKELEVVFHDIKTKNNIYLTPHKGECCASYCNKGCQGISFLGNQTNDYLDLIFEEVEDEFQDIYKCNSFKIYNSEIQKQKPMKLSAYLVDIGDIDDAPF